MNAERKIDSTDRPDTPLAALHSSTLNDLLKRAARWRLYAAVTGSAVAMATNGSVSRASGGASDLTARLMPALLQAQHFSPTSSNTPLLESVRSALASRNSGLSFSTAAVPGAQPNQSTMPVIGAIVPASGTVSVIQPGEWVSIYGTRLASATAVWNGDFPTSLGGTSVNVNGRAAFLSLVSPGQINLQAPDDTATGPVSVVVTTSTGAASVVVMLSRFSPSFLLLNPTHVAAIILRQDHSGAYLNGAYDILGPTGNCFGYYTVAAKAGDLLEIFGVGFGPTTPAVPAGKVFSGAAPISSSLSLYLNNVRVEPTFVGLSSAGVYQINVVVPPGLGQGDISIQASIGGMLTQASAVFSLQGPSSTGPPCIVYTGDGGDGDGGDGWGDGGDGDGGGGDGGGGDGGGGDGGGGDGDGGDGGDGGCD